MPELPDIELYRTALLERVGGRRLEGVRVSGPSWLRSVDPPLAAAAGRRVDDVRRLGKRLAIALAGDGEPLFLVLHLMIAGRLRWRPCRTGATAPPAVPARRGLGALDFAHGSVLVTEASPRKRATLHLVRGEAALAAHDPGGLEPLEADAAAFAARLLAERHTVKRALTDPRLFSGIGNAYSDEILHRARLSPFRMTDALDDAELVRLSEAARSVLAEWRDRLLVDWRASGTPFPEQVTAFRPEMAVHGRHRQPCPDCAAPVQRIAYADSESNYCARCQTAGRLLADRALSRLLHGDWPRTLAELEERLDRLRAGVTAGEPPPDPGAAAPSAPERRPARRSRPTRRSA